MQMVELVVELSVEFFPVVHRQDVQLANLRTALQAKLTLTIGL